MCMTINVDFLPSTSIEDAVSEAKAKADMWGVSYVRFKFNGVDFAIGAGANVYSVVNQYREARHKSHIVAA